MYLNVLGHVRNSGHHLVHEDVDFMTAIAVAGGYLPGANLEEITLIRQEQLKQHGNQKCFRN